LHTRFVKLANSAGSVEVLGLRCLTESAGKHPLFEGIRRATIELPGPPRIEEDAGTIRITSEGLTVAYRGGLTARGQVYIIHEDAGAAACRGRADRLVVYNIDLTPRRRAGQAPMRALRVGLGRIARSVREGSGW